jgi:soluble lytic murein transglycosylase-like protein
LVPGIPQLAYTLKPTLVREINYWWGVDTKRAIFFAQVHQESSWNPKAKSKYASGLAQFTSDTATWISGLYPYDLGDNNPMDAGWALRALTRYDKWLYDKTIFADEKNDKWSFSLSGYNGGWGWVLKDRKLCYDAPCCCNQNVWRENVEHFSDRADWAIKENRSYVVKILDKWVPLYEKGGF